jgi:formylglycine-generating enzyme required for sulfatase activity
MIIQYRIALLFSASTLMILSSCTSQVTPTRPSEATQTNYAMDNFVTKLRPDDGMTMVYVPAGHFEMGNNSDEQARPVHSVFLDGFWIDQTEVTNSMFTTFLNNQGNQSDEGTDWLEPGAGHRGIVYGHIEYDNGAYRTEAGYEDHPVIEVSWFGAAAYCSRVGGRLPTEAEWEYAARSPQSWSYPWGNEFDGSRANYCDINCTYNWRNTGADDGFELWAPVGSYRAGASWCGALDMAGNVWEWTNDWWAEDYYRNSPTQNPPGPETGTLRVARGASWYDEGDQRPLSIRKALTSSSYRMHWIGFRCVVPEE